jgi:exosome complex component RRP41
MNQEPLFVGSFREDGRRFKENRSIKIEMGIIKESSGSCLFNLGETKVVAWIRGPCETKTKCPDNSGIIKCYFNQAPFSGILHKSNQKQDIKNREFGQTIKSIFNQIIQLENYKKSEININVLVLQNDGNYKSAAINAVSLALINAGIFTKDSVVGINVGYLDETVMENGLLNDMASLNEENKVIYDLQLSEEKNYVPTLNIAYLPNSGKFIYLQLTNAQTPYNKLIPIIKEAIKSADNLYKEIKSILINLYKK